MGSGVSRSPNSSFSGQLPHEEMFYTAQENNFCLLAPFSLALSEHVHVIELKDRQVTFRRSTGSIGEVRTSLNLALRDWGCTPETPTLNRIKQEDHEFQARLSSMSGPCLQEDGEGRKGSRQGDNRDPEIETN